ncbi:MarR family transcriptional regulator [Micromonospora robiginosa]|uniref:Replication-relaxation family protein n=1 Tax=Micromonospora robiginosa TaxID=2749844 RepID=A0A7L6BCE5_9ACTN|nr:MarR family transcriptional regulator [Micromonospora ferruginea]QLQ39622.2 replication-relaxation family protein [Micromonospora ferruginea]
MAGDGELTPRRWRILSFLALHGSATTSDIAVVAGVPRLTAHRDLTWLHIAGLVGRERSAEDRAHAWWYRITGEGTELLGRDLISSGRPVPLHLGQRHWRGAHYLLFLPLLEASRQDPGRCGLFQWLTTLDTSVWLRERGLAHLRADGYGVWLEDGRCVRFLVHVDAGPVGGAIAERERATAGLDAVLAGYRRSDPVVPVGVVLVIARDEAREVNLLDDLVSRPLRAPIAVTTVELLQRCWPHEQVWRMPAVGTDRHRLIDLPLPPGLSR